MKSDNDRIIEAYQRFVERIGDYNIYITFMDVRPDGMCRYGYVGEDGVDKTFEVHPSVFG